MASIRSTSPRSAADADAPATETTTEEADDVDGTETARFDPNAHD